ncbi:hypothetical protein IKS_05663 [Bacillus cereus VDM062]|nr:hypothetical protein IKO_05563 [Bacillus cereus VDM034]EJS11300.1 hypothetical protein IKS_05663 [Bacillus cereus VDM062]
MELNLSYNSYSFNLFLKSELLSEQDKNVLSI